MNKEIRCITNKGKMAQNKWENNEFLRAYEYLNMLIH